LLGMTPKLDVGPRIHPHGRAKAPNSNMRGGYDNGRMYAAAVPIATMTIAR
jgi:hypothetical protein